MTYRERLIQQLVEEVAYFKRAYLFKKSELEEIEKKRRRDYRDKLATAALIAACGLAVYFTLAGLGNFGYWLEHGWS